MAIESGSDRPGLAPITAPRAASSLILVVDDADGDIMDESAREPLDHAFELIALGDLVGASVVVGGILSTNPNHPYGLLAWGQILQARGQLDSAIEAHQAAARFAPVDAHVHFALADSLRARARTESPYFRRSTWARARTAAEHGLYLDPDNETGRALLVDILERQLGDDEVTRDSTPPDMLPIQRPRHLEVRSPRLDRPAVPAHMALFSTMAFWRSVWWLAPIVLVVLWLLWSWISAAFTWVDLVVTAVLVYGTLLGFRAWLGPRVEQRRRQVDF